jgi:hypothetical protein
MHSHWRPTVTRARLPVRLKYTQGEEMSVAKVQDTAYPQEPQKTIGLLPGECWALAERKLHFLNKGKSKCQLTWRARQPGHCCCWALKAEDVNF